VLYGSEQDFPPALVDRINVLGGRDVSADHMEVGAVEMADPSGYDLIVDRISHAVPFYRSFLKNAVLTGTEVINDPFGMSAHDRFFQYSLADQLDIAVPPTALLPHKILPEGTTHESLRNLAYPLNWERIFDYVGFPAFLKNLDNAPASARHVDSAEEFFRAYDESGQSCMILQRAVRQAEYFRCYTIGESAVHLARCDAHGGHAPLAAPLRERMEGDTRRLCRALGWDVHAVEFAVEDGIAWAIDFLNPASEASVERMDPEGFRWAVEAMADLVVRRALAPGAAPHRWARRLAGERAG
jgi:hypothetical protein